MRALRLCSSASVRSPLRPRAGHCCWQQPRRLLGTSARAAPACTPHLIVGTYSIDTGYATGHAPGAYLVRLDATTGALDLASAVTAPSIGTNPAYAAYCAAKRTVYFTNEVVDGVIKAFALGDDGTLTFVNEMPSGGEGPCFIAVGPGDEGNVYCGTCRSRQRSVARRQRYFDSRVA